MLLSTVLFLLGASQLTLAEPASESGVGNIGIKQLTSKHVTLVYDLNDTACDEPSIRVWKFDAPFTHNPKAVRNTGAAKGQVTFSLKRLGFGEWKAAVVCANDQTLPVAVSDKFQFTARQCTVTLPNNGYDKLIDNKDTNRTQTVLCKRLPWLCYDCEFNDPDGCVACEQCKEQCDTEDQFGDDDFYLGRPEN